MASNTAENQETAFAIADTKLYVQVLKEQLIGTNISQKYQY